MPSRPFVSQGYAGGLDNRIGPSSSGADLRLTVCCRPGRYVRSNNALYRSGFVKRFKHTLAIDAITRELLLRSPGFVNQNRCTTFD